MNFYNSKKSNLNQEQQLAVESVHGPVMCIAGPGSGKTLTIVHRLINMIKNHSIEPTNILVVTFSKASAIEMRKRFLRAINDEDCKVNFGTFHSIFFQLLKKEYGYTQENILAEGASSKIILSLLDKQKNALLSSADIIYKLFSEISLVKSVAINPREFKSSVMSSEDFTLLYKGYNDYLSEMNLIDFEDMLQKTHELLTTNQKALEHWQNKFKYILIDEFQDINPIQYSIVKLLAKPENNLFIVGDDDQAIYSFRGSSPSIMKTFPEDFKGAKTIMLTTNYRCSEEILKEASKVISYNVNRFPKALSAANKGGEKVAVKGFEDSYKEYDYLATHILEELSNGIKPEEIAVLCRTNSQCAAIAAHLLKYDIPFNLKGNIPTLYDNRHLVPVISYIKFLAGDNSRENFLQFCNKPVRYITRDSLSDIIVDPDKLLLYYEKSGKDYVVSNLQKLISDLSFMQNLDTAAAIRYIRNVVGYEKYLEDNLNYKDEFLEEIIDYLDELETDAVPFRSFTSFLEHIEDYRQKLIATKQNSQESVINLVTYHGCKGLEYDSVYMPDCMDKVTPHRLAHTNEEIEEERRMFYVAMTRARKRLVLSHSAKKHGREYSPSRFINEILISSKKPIKGTRIIHQIYSTGTIISLEGDVMLVKFDKILVPKKLSYKHCIEKGHVEILS